MHLALSRLLAQDALQGMALLGGVVILCFVMMRHSRKKMSEPRLSAREQVQERVDQLKEQHEVKMGMEELLVQLQEVSRNINAQIDTKFSKLEASIRAADQRIDQLQRSVRQSEGQLTVDTVVSDSPTPSPEPQEPAPPASDTAQDPRTDQIYALADQGKSIVEIAQQMGAPSGEVELILALRGKS